jgi:TonB-linked SusC/RagA family outer membrane protein
MAPDYTQPKPDFNFWRGFGDGTPSVYEGLENGTDFDWWDAGTQSGLINSHNLSVSGSQKNLTYFVSLGYTDQQNIIMNDDFTRKTARINLSNQILPWFKVGVSTFGSFSDFSGASPSLGNLLTQPPVVKPYDDEGNLIPSPNGQQSANPFLATQADDFDKRNHLSANFYTDIDIPFVKGLSYRLNYGNNYSWDRHYYSNIYRGTTKAGEAYKMTTNKYDWTFENILTYKRLFADKHNLDVTLLYGRRELKYEDTNARGTDYSTMKLGYNDLSIATNQTIHSSAWDESFLYQMGRVNYRYNNRYLFTATLRRDGFSGFSKSNKFAYFPSLALGWNLSEEQFMNIDLIDQLKLRASWGANGNLADRYSSLARLELYPAYVSGDGGSTILGQRVTTMANSNLKWETTVGFNFGVDFSLLTNRLYGNVDYYITTTNDLIWGLDIPVITGFGEITSNVGELANRGIELQIGGEVIKKGKFRWDLNFNFSSNKNEIKSLIGLDADGDGKEDDLVASGLFIGESIGTIYTYETDGMVQIGDENVPKGWLPGTYRIVDNHKDGFYDPNDRVIIGRQEPAYRFGILNTLNFDNFELKFFINSIQGGKNGYLGQNMPDNNQNHFVQTTFKEHDYWSPLNPDAKWRNLLNSAPVDYVVYDDKSFIRLQDVSLSYRMSPTLLNQLGLKGCKIYVSGKNLVTITDWIGWDPETGAGINRNGRPVLRGYTIGLDLSF